MPILTVGGRFLAPGSCPRPTAEGFTRRRSPVRLTMQEIDFHRALHRPGTIVDAGAHHGRLRLPRNRSDQQKLVRDTDLRNHPGLDEGVASLAALTFSGVAAQRS